VATTLAGRFENAGTAPHAVKAISLVLVDKRRFRRRKKFGDVELDRVSNRNKRNETIRLDPGLEIAPRLLSDSYHLEFDPLTVKVWHVNVARGAEVKNSVL